VDPKDFTERYEQKEGMSPFLRVLEVTVAQPRSCPWPSRSERRRKRASTGKERYCEREYLAQARTPTVVTTTTSAPTFNPQFKFALMRATSWFGDGRAPPM